MPPRATTPARVTRSRAGTPLPALQARQSHAYGSAGKADIQAQVTQSYAAMDEAFTSTRRKLREPSAAPLAGAALRPKRGRKPKTQTPADDVSDDELDIEPPVKVTRKPRPIPRYITDEMSLEEDQSRPGTGLQDSATYGNAASLLPPPPPITRRSPPSETIIPSSPKIGYEPGFLRLCWRTFRAWLPSPSLLLFIGLVCSIFLGLVFFLGTIAAWAPLPANIAPRRDEIFRGIRIIAGVPDIPPWELEYLWLKVRHNKMWAEEVPDLGNQSIHKMQFIFNRNMLGRIKDLENSTATLGNRVGLAEDTLAEIQRILPGNMAMVEENGELVIPAPFWQALVQKLQNQDAAPLWDRFIEQNRVLIAAADDQFTAAENREYAKSHALVSRTEFQDAIVKSQSLMENDFSERLHAFKGLVLKEARRVATEAILPRVELEALAYSNLLRNIDGRLRETNYFSTGLGAFGHPHYTSPTFGAPSTTQRGLRWISWATGFSYLYQPRVLPHPPVAALLSWEEGTQCWCAAPSQDEKALAQLTVQMSHKISPKSLVIEHVPSSGTRDIQAAPQDFEVWAQLDSAAEAVQVQNLLDMKVSSDYGFNCGKPPAGERNWVCIYTGSYDIHATNYVQVYTLHHAATDVGLYTSKVAVRVTKNWGGDHTCLYRVRLTGSEQLRDQEAWAERLKQPPVEIWS